MIRSIRASYTDWRNGTGRCNGRITGAVRPAIAHPPAQWDRLPLAGPTFPPVESAQRAYKETVCKVRTPGSGLSRRIGQPDPAEVGKPGLQLAIRGDELLAGPLRDGDVEHVVDRPVVVPPGQLEGAAGVTVIRHPAHRDPVKQGGGSIGVGTAPPAPADPGQQRVFRLQPEQAGSQQLRAGARPGGEQCPHRRVRPGIWRDEIDDDGRVNDGHDDPRSPGRLPSRGPEGRARTSTAGPRPATRPGCRAVRYPPDAPRRPSPPPALPGARCRRSRCYRAWWRAGARTRSSGGWSPVTGARAAQPPAP